MTYVRDMEHFYADFGLRVAEVREKLNVSQGALARQVGLSRTSIVNIEKGRQRVLLHTALELADALGVSFDQLIPPPPEAGPDPTQWIERILSQGGVHENEGASGQA
jgi:DNA-binding XRE family transcriptional regulator